MLALAEPDASWSGAVAFRRTLVHAAVIRRRSPSLTLEAPRGAYEPEDVDAALMEVAGDMTGAAANVANASASSDTRGEPVEQLAV